MSTEIQQRVKHLEEELKTFSSALDTHTHIGYEATMQNILVTMEEQAQRLKNVSKEGTELDRRLIAIETKSDNLMTTVGNIAASVEKISGQISEGQQTDAAMKATLIPMMDWFRQKSARFWSSLAVIVAISSGILGTLYLGVEKNSDQILKIYSEKRTVVRDTVIIRERIQDGVQN